MHSVATLSTWWISVPCVYVAPCAHVSASACQLSKLARTESGVDRLKQTHTWRHIHTLHAYPLSLRPKDCSLDVVSYGSMN